MNRFRFIRSGVIVPLAYPLFSAGLCLAEDESLPGNPPKLAPGIITCDDGSRWHGFTFHARLGLGYVVESSTDLKTWETTEGFPGSGQQQVCLMKELPPLSAPEIPPSGPPAPGPLVPLANLILQPAASGGGVVISWASLDDGRAMKWHFPALVRDAKWDDMVGYHQRFGNYHFNLSDPPFPATPPVTNPPAGPKDAALLAAFELYFPDMNAEVIASASRVWSQTVTPPVPGARRFWRVRCNWGMDTDSDGTPDWMEYQQMFDAAAGNNPVIGPPPDPFSGDANGDGTPDGNQRSSDGDNIPDALDAEMNDRLINWEKKPPFRYALFPMASEGQALQPVQINDRGDVLFSGNRLWTAGAWRELPAAAGSLVNCVAGCMDDAGRIYGFGNLVADRQYPCAVTWPPGGGGPFALMAGSEYVDPAEKFIPGGQSKMVVTSQLDGGRQLLAYARVFVPLEGGGVDFARIKNGLDEGILYRWEAKGDNGQPFLFSKGSAVAATDLYVAPNGSSMGYRGGVAYVGDQELPSLGRMAATPSGGWIIPQSFGPPRILDGTQWKQSKTLDDLILGFSTLGGFAIKERAGFWFNGTHKVLDELAPGLPEVWKDTFSCSLVDTTAGGWTLMTRREFGPQSPLLESVLGLPLALEDDLPYTGLDDVSLTAIPFTAASPAKMAIINAGIQKEFWVMVPAGNESSIRVISPLGGNTSVSFGSDKVRATPAIVTSPSSLLRLYAPASADGTNETVPVKVGAVNSLTVPLRAKMMKSRNLEVTIWPINRATPGQNVVNCPPLPSLQVIEEFLNGIYKPQLNLSVTVSIKPTASVNYDLADNAGARLPPWDPDRPVTQVKPGNAQYDVNDNPTTEQLEVMKDNRVAPLGINIYVIGGAAELWPWGVDEAGKIELGMPLKGFTNRDLRACWVAAGTLDPDGQFPPPFLGTLAHEIGHVLFGAGHPNREDGLAPLPHTDTTKRLMFSGGIALDPHTHRRRIVKAEWDEAERWMKIEELNGRMGP